MNGVSPIDEFPDLGEIFKMFGMFRGGNNQFIRGPTISTNIKLTLEQLEIGGIFKIKYQRNIPTGKLKQTVANHGFGQMIMMSPEEITKEYEINIEIPPCYDQQKPLVFPGQAKAENVPPGDLEVHVILINHETYKRISGTLDIIIEIKLSLKESLIGFTKFIKLLNSDEETKIECESVVNPYATKMITEYGMYNSLTGKKGNLHLKFNIIFPLELCEETKKILQSLGEL
jgi:DnaJ-class molecular chaperone